MKIPSVHLNGTSRDELRRQLIEAQEALALAIAMLHKAAPHPRDYYVQRDEDAYKTANAEHKARVAKLQAVQMELIEIAETLADVPRHRHAVQDIPETQP